MSHRNRNVLIAVIAVLVVGVGALIVTHKSTPSITERNAAYFQQVQTAHAAYCAQPIGANCKDLPADSDLLAVGQRACAILVNTQPESTSTLLLEMSGGDASTGDDRVLAGEVLSAGVDNFCPRDDGGNGHFTLIK